MIGITEHKVKGKKIPLRYKLGENLAAIGPVLTSHHPVCNYFTEHTFGLFGRRWCIGCFIGYPSTLITFFGGLFTGVWRASDAILLLITGTILGTITIFAGRLIPEKRKFKIIQKAILGISAGILLGSGFARGNFINNLLITLTVLFIGVGVLNVIHVRKMEKICRTCPYGNKRPNCPGLEVMEIARTAYKNKHPEIFGNPTETKNKEF